MLAKSCYNVPEALEEVCWTMRTFGKEEDSRNGPVVSIQTPLLLTIEHPTQRVLTDPIRDANPFFHVMEFIWMMAGSDDIKWVARFNKNMLKFSDDGLTQNAAYGHRWRRRFDYDQIASASALLKRNPQDRRVILSMWDPRADLGSSSVDVPCNTQIMPRVVGSRLDFLVTNRSNDLIWGMLGANAVHMTMLHELMAQSLKLGIGSYRVITNNLHIYKSVPNYDYYMKGSPGSYDVYPRTEVRVPLLQYNETLEDFLTDAEEFVRNDGNINPRTYWFKNVAQPMFLTWMFRKQGMAYNTYLEAIVADDWRIACSEWISRRQS